MSEKRDAYVAKMKTKLDKWNTEIGALEAKARQVGIESKAGLQNQVDVVQAKYAEVTARVENLRRASEDTWKDLRGDVEGSWKALEKAGHSVIANFRRSTVAEES